MPRRVRRSDLFSIAGWLFADLMLALTLIFLASSTQASPPPTVTTVPSPTPTPTVTPTLTPVPSRTLTPTGTPTSSLTPSPTRTLVPSPTPTRVCDKTLEEQPIDVFLNEQKDQTQINFFKPFYRAKFVLYNKFDEQDLLDHNKAEQDFLSSFYIEYDSQLTNKNLNRSDVIPALILAYGSAVPGQTAAGKDFAQKAADLLRREQHFQRVNSVRSFHVLNKANSDLDFTIFFYSRARC